MNHDTSNGQDLPLEKSPEPPAGSKNQGVTLPPNGTPGIDTVPPQNDAGK